MKNKPIEFTPPQSLLDQVGTNIAPDTRVELMTSYSVKPDGKWCITGWEGVPAPGYDADGNKEGNEHESMPRGNFTESYSREMGAM